MQKKKRKSVIVVLAAWMLSVCVLSGYGIDPVSTTQQTTKGGVLYLRVNPEIAVFYDAAKVSKKSPSNDFVRKKVTYASILLFSILVFVNIDNFFGKKGRKTFI